MASRSWDIDLPTLVLCNICTFLITSDPAMFDELGESRRHLSEKGSTVE